MKVRYLLFACTLLLAASCDRGFNPPVGEDLLHRQAYEFRKTRDEVREYIRQYIPDVTEQQIDEWTQNGTLESMEINGERRYFSRTASNLFLVDSACKARKDAITKASVAESISGNAFVDDEQEQIDYFHKLIDNCRKTGRSIGGGEDILGRHAITVNADAVPAGEIIRCWIPFPRRDIKRNSNVKLLGTSCDKYRISDIKAPHSSVYMEQKAEAGKPTVFWIEYSLSAFGEYHDLSCIQSAAYNKDSDLYKRYTCEQAPHIVFSDRMKALSDSLTAGLRNPVDKAKAIFCWIRSKYPWAGAITYGLIPNIPEYVLDSGHGDCGQVTLLFMTLARIAGIPCAWESGLTDEPSEGWNMHDWCRVYFEGIGWVPVDQSAGIPDYAEEYPELRWKNFGGVNQYRIIINNAWGKELQPRKKYPRSEPVDFQLGEVEWKGGNLYFDAWDQDINFKRINN